MAFVAFAVTSLVIVCLSLWWVCKVPPKSRLNLTSIVQGLKICLASILSNGDKQRANHSSKPLSSLSASITASDSKTNLSVSRSLSPQTVNENHPAPSSSSTLPCHNSSTEISSRPCEDVSSVNEISCDTEGEIDSDGSYQIINRPSEFELKQNGIPETNLDVAIRPSVRVSDTFQSRCLIAEDTTTSCTPPCSYSKTGEQESSEAEDVLKKPSEDQSSPLEESSVKDANFVCGQNIEAQVDENLLANLSIGTDQPPTTGDKEKKQNEPPTSETCNREGEEKECDSSSQESVNEHLTRRRRQLEWVKQKALELHLECKQKAKNKEKVEEKVEKNDEATNENDACRNISSDEDDLVSDFSDLSEDRNENMIDPDDSTPDLNGAQDLKNDGNVAFKAENFEEAIHLYSKALLKCPDDKDNDSLISILLCNRAACYLSQRRFEDVISDCTDSISFDSTYVKAYLRRFRANEALEKWHDALADINKAIELDPSLRHTYYSLQKKVEKLSQEQFEKEKAELMDKLKSVGNWALGKIGLSLNNFKLDQNPETGSYNIQFVQNPQSESQT